MDEDSPSDEPEQASAPRRSSLGLAILAFLAVVLSAAGALFYQSRQGTEKSSIDVSGFDVAQVEAARRVVNVSAPAAAPAASSLGMVGGAGGLSFGEAGKESSSGSGAAASGQPGQPAPAQKFADMCKANEARARAMGEAYTKKYPVFMKYGRDWMSKPDLKKLNDDYMKNHDPVAFVRGLAASKTFPLLVRQYATDPAIQAFAKDALAHAPAGLMSAGIAMAKKEHVINALMDHVAAAMGLPAGMFKGDDGQAPKAPDQNAVMNSMANGNPDVQKALGGAGVGGLGGILSNPAVSGAIKNDPKTQGMLNGNPDVQKMLGQPQQQH